MFTWYEDYKAKVNKYIKEYGINIDDIDKGDLEQRIIFGFYYQVSPETIARELQWIV